MFTHEMRQGLNLTNNDKIIGFIYLGTVKVAKPLPILETSDFLEHWTGE